MLPVFLISLFVSGVALAQTAGVDVFVNELHYDNVGGDAGEGLEIAGPAGVDLSTFTLSLYNGSNGSVYNTPTLTGIIPDEGNGYGTLCFLITGIQNGSPDGIALTDGGGTTHFISYEGSFTATDGPAVGLTSTDIGVSEGGTTQIGESLQLIGNGTVYSDFTWSGPTTGSPCSINVGQSFGFTCNTFNTITEVACDSYTVPSGDETYTASGMYMDTIPNTALCDSIITIDLTINNSYTGITDAIEICDGTSYTFGTQTLTTAGVYTETFTATNGCDSTVELTLTTVTSFTTNLVETICNGEEYILGLQTLTTTGNYSELFTSSLGCDSTVNVDLTVLPNSTNTLTEVSCGSYTVPSGDETYTTSGMYMDTIQSTNGCDSVLTINLTINDTNLVVFTESACDSYVFEGNTYTSSGTYDVMFMNQALCDSTRRLILTITNTPGAPTITADQNLCIGDIPTDIQVSVASGSDLMISGVMDAQLPGGLPKCVEFYAINNIPDLSIYGFGSANNGNGSDGVEFTFPAISLNAGDYYRVGTDSLEFNNFMGYFPNEADTWAPNINGDDAVELWLNNAVVDAFGDSLVDGTGQPWEYQDGWAYRNNGTTPNGGAFDPNNWTYSGINALDGETSNATAAIPFPDGTFTTFSTNAILEWYDDAGLTNNINTGTSFTPASTVGVQNFYVTATVNGCTSTAAQSVVTINDLPPVDAGTAQTVCEFDQVTLSGSGADTYTWDNGVNDGVAFTANATQTYTVTGEDANGCTNTDQVIVTVNPLPTVTYTDINTICSYDAPITLAAGSPAGGTYFGTGVSGTTFDPSVPGIGTSTITYSYTDMNGCTNSENWDITVDGCLGITDPNLSGDLLVYPNPTKGNVTINGLPSGGSMVNVIDLNGRKLISFESTAQIAELDLQSLAPGQYLIEIHSNDILITKRICKALSFDQHKEKGSSSELPFLLFVGKNLLLLPQRRHYEEVIHSTYYSIDSIFSLCSRELLAAKS
jgi:hypothetical protein